MISFLEAFRGSSIDVGDGLGVPVHAHDHGPVERGVGLAVAASVESVAGCLP